MGAIRPPGRAKFFVGMLSGDPGLLDEAHRRIRHQLGDLELISDRWPFTGTRYYEQELGTEIWRQFVSLRQLQSVERLPEIKRLTNALESRFCDDLALESDQRPINLDPGYVTLSKVVLATTKDFSHRLYLGLGIYGEVTLRFEGGSWQPWPWTYPDYAAATYDAWFLTVRERLKEQLRAGPP